MSKVTMWRSRWRCVIKPAYSVSFLFSINIFVWQNVLYFLDAPLKSCGNKGEIMKLSILGGNLIFGLRTPTVILDITQHFGNWFSCHFRLLLSSCVWDVLSHWSKGFGSSRSVMKRVMSPCVLCASVFPFSNFRIVLRDFYEAGYEPSINEAVQSRVY